MAAQIPLPNPAELIDSLLHEIQSISEDDETSITTADNPRFEREKADKTSRVRPILLTLHVLFPHILLPALDILDRRLITKRGNPSCSQDVFTSQGATGISLEENAMPDPRINGSSGPHIYYIQSTTTPTTWSSTSTSTSAATPTRPRHPYSNKSTTSSTKFYEVHLQAWNCTCPAFTISSFINQDLEADDSTGSSALHTQREGTDMSTDRVSRQVLKFGGLLDKSRRNSMMDQTSRAQNMPPTCKHILSALLAEVCPSVFGEGMFDQDGEFGDELRRKKEASVSDDEILELIEEWRFETAGRAAGWS